MAFTQKVSGSEQSSYWHNSSRSVVGLADTPALTTTEMQEKFVQPVDKLTYEFYNLLVDALNASTGASNMGAMNGETETNVQAILTTLLGGKANADRLVTMLADVNAVETTLTTATDKIPTSKAVYDAMEAGGLGDMLKAVYDTTNKHQDIFLYADSAVATGVANKADKSVIKSITLDTSWSGDSSPYTHSVSISGYTVTSNTKCDIQADSTVIAQMSEDGTSAIYIDNTNGVLTAYAVGEKPTASLTLQVTLTEVSV